MGKKFYRVNIEISNICNLQCSFCPEVVRPKKRMDVALFERVISQVAPLTRLVTFHLMGDPLIHPDLSALVDICERRGVRIFFVTNGVLLKEKDISTLLRPSFHQVSFSLHSYADNFPDADPSAYLAKIFSFTERAFEASPRLFINYRLWNLNDARGKSNQNHFLVRAIEERFRVSLIDAIATRQKKNVPVTNRLSLHFDEEFIWPGADLPILGTEGTCYGLSSHFGVLVDGTVVPCCLDKEGVINLGNIETTPIAEILASKKAQNILAGFRRHELVEALCQRCQFIKRFEPAKKRDAPKAHPAHY
jgi:radical SAM protein with 4Fe4S-binding SPASM domain